MQRTLLMGVKRPGRSVAATSVAGPSPSRLFHVKDHTTSTQFLVDTGSKVCVILPSASDHKHVYAKLTLTAVNNTPITTYGQRSLTLNLDLRRTFQWVVIIANVPQPIIGADFLLNFGPSLGS